MSYSCPLCEWKTSRGVGMLYRHLTNIHDADKGAEDATVWRCDQCEFETNKKRVYNLHMDRHVRRHVCTHCNRGFINKQNLRNHSRLHTGEQPFKCDYEGCKYSTIQKRCLDEHTRKHTGERLQCEKCPFTTVYITALKNHISMRHTEKSKYKCTYEQCTYITNDKACFEKHSKLHLNQKDFACYLCNYRSVTKSQVVAHVQRVHNQEKAYACKSCSFTTAYPWSLRDHIMSHLGIKPFSCPLCKFSASQKNKILYHLSAKHPGLESTEVLDSGVKLDIDLNEYRVEKSPSQKQNFYTVTQFHSKAEAKDSMREVDEQIQMEADVPTTVACQQPEVTLYDNVPILDGHFQSNIIMAVTSSETAASTTTLLPTMRNMTEGLRLQSADAVATVTNTQITVIKAELDNGPVTSRSGPNHHESQIQNGGANHVTVLKDNLLQVVSSISANESPLSVDTSSQGSDSSLYQCSSCDFVSADYDVLATHVMLHQGIRLYQCPQCGFSLPDMDLVLAHCSEAHPECPDIAINEIDMSLKNTSCDNVDEENKMAAVSSATL